MYDGAPIPREETRHSSSNTDTLFQTNMARRAPSQSPVVLFVARMFFHRPSGGTIARKLPPVDTRDAAARRRTKPSRGHTPHRPLEPRGAQIRGERDDKRHDVVNIVADRRVRTYTLAQRANSTPHRFARVYARCYVVCVERRSRVQFSRRDALAAFFFFFFFRTVRDSHLEIRGFKISGTDNYRR